MLFKLFSLLLFPSSFLLLCRSLVFAEHCHPVGKFKHIVTLWHMAFYLNTSLFMCLFIGSLLKQSYKYQYLCVWLLDF